MNINLRPIDTRNESKVTTSINVNGDVVTYDGVVYDPVCF